MIRFINIIRVAFILFFLTQAGIALWLDFNFADGSQWLISNSQLGKFIAHSLISIAPELAGIVISVIIID